ncbi:TetR family transcriptional regulator [Nocardioides panacisoli]|uniref:TetR family transcriptional regulator n=1 Tax=Nocardioides panacisoli TaxID=627624 RepID=UPI001C62AF6C|nr:TetR family transcriptional regulator [Nocardioides panacisoli]QYJ04889.1 TetR family transcriptional regulator [Nocardioides panacisoli]
MTITKPASGEDSGSSAQQERRKRILDATYALASEGGFDAVQMRAVADQADVALGTLYRYFPSKIHLLVSALQREFESAVDRLNAKAIPGDTAADRVIHVLKRLTRGMQGDPQLTEALTRAFMFADASVANEIHGVGMSMTAIVTHAMHGGVPTDEDITDEDIAIARVIGDVWLSALVGWVTGRSTANETAAHMDTAVRLVLR